METNSASHSPIAGGVPGPEPRPIYLRAYAEAGRPNASAGNRVPDQPSPYVIVFDCETSTDPSQHLRFGSYQVRHDGRLREKGLFYDPDAVTDEELIQLQQHRPPGQALRTLRSFVEEIFFDIGYKADAVIVGFNLPFDISRLAIGHDTARRVTRNRRGERFTDQSMVGGFTFKLSTMPGRPNVRVKHLSRRAAFINFAAPDENPGGGGNVSRGFFLDLKTLAAALTSKSFSLDRLAVYLGVGRKRSFHDFNRPIDPEYMAYAAQDSETTRLCYEALMRQCAEHGLAKTEVTRIYSEASLGKAYLRSMGIKPWLAVETDGYSAVSIGRIMSAYYGGRAEVHRRREVVRTAYCDFASMYPTVCTLMGLWPFVIAMGVTEHDATDDVRALLAEIRLAKLADPEFWKNLRVLVEVEPDADIFPVRARYGEGPSHTIGVNYLSTPDRRNLWFTLADCIASALLAGKPPKVVSAVRFEPKPPQTGLRPVSVAGSAQRVDPRGGGDFYRQVINIRRQVKSDLGNSKRDGAPKLELDRLDARQTALKILANATAYGIFIELNPEEADDAAGPVTIYGADAPFPADPTKIEKPGPFFHPLLATLITGAARLMLAITERLALDAGLDWAFCDTDSMAFAKPDGPDEATFQERVASICGWFENLNPYEGGGSILEMEDQNFRTQRRDDGSNAIARDEDGQAIRRPLYCFAVSAKRYALFNIGDRGEILIRKASAHGLGHLMAPYADPDPDPPPRESGVSFWQEDVWRAIIRAALDGHPERVALDWDASLAGIAASQHTASTPALLRAFRHHNAARAYAERVKPFNFMLWFYAKQPAERLWADGGIDPDWNSRQAPPKPASPYYPKPSLVPADEIFDRDTDAAIPISALRTYADVLRGYHRSPETKFLGGGPADFGPLQRRHILAETAFYIGKEADSFEEVEDFGAGEEDVTLYGPATPDRAKMVEAIASAPVRALKRRAKVGHDLVARAALGAPSVKDHTLAKIYRAAVTLADEAQHKAEREAELVAWARDWAERHSVAELARRISCDPANLSFALRKRRLGKTIRRNIENLWRTLDADIRILELPH